MDQEAAASQEATESSADAGEVLASSDAPDAPRERRRAEENRVGAATFLAFQEGDPDAAARVVEAYSGRMIGFLFMQTRNRDTAEELAQEVFLAMFRQRRDIRDEERLRPWLFTVARRKAMKEMAKRRRAAELSVGGDDLLDALAPGQEPRQGRDLLTDEARALTLEALESLPDAERQLVELRYFGELSIKDLSAALDMPMGTVGVKLGRALKKTRDWLEARGHRLEDFLP